MPRPRRVDQEVLLERIADALTARTSIRPWTLVEIAPAAGLSPAGLVKRFGSRKGVLVALSRRWSDAIPTSPRGDQPARDELQAWVHGRFAPADAHATAQGLIQLVDDLMDDELAELLVEGWTRERAYLAALLTACALPGVVDPEACAGILFDSLNGAMLRRTTTGDADPVTRTLDTFVEMWS